MVSCLFKRNFGKVSHAIELKVFLVQSLECCRKHCSSSDFLYASDQLFDTFFFQDSVGFIDEKVLDFFEPVLVHMLAEFANSSNGSNKDNGGLPEFFNIGGHIRSSSGAVTVFKIFLNPLF